MPINYIMHATRTAAGEEDEEKKALFESLKHDYEDNGTTSLAPNREGLAMVQDRDGFWYVGIVISKQTEDRSNYGSGKNLSQIQFTELEDTLIKQEIRRVFGIDPFLQMWIFTRDKG